MSDVSAVAVNPFEIEPFSSSAPSVPQLGGSPIRWSWACRVLDRLEVCSVVADASLAPTAGDLVLVEVQHLGEHERITTCDNKRLRIYTGDLLVGVLGNRYATDAFEGVVHDVRELQLLTGGGMIGTVRSKHRNMSAPTEVLFVGYIADSDGARINLTRRCFKPRPRPAVTWPLVLVVGTAMNSGKTTASVKLIKNLVDRGIRVGACKLTGSVSNRDQDEMRAATAGTVLDFSDYGFPSTYLCSETELLTLFDTMLADLAARDPEIVVMEVADGVLQRETAMLLRDDTVRRAVSGLIVTADGALSALYATHELRALGHRVLAVSGALTSSPLAVREFTAQSDVPVAHSTGSGREVADIVTQSLGLR